MKITYLFLNLHSKLSDSFISTDCIKRFFMDKSCEGFCKNHLLPPLTLSIHSTSAIIERAFSCISTLHLTEQHLLAEARYSINFENKISLSGANISGKQKTVSYVYLWSDAP